MGSRQNLESVTINISHIHLFDLINANTVKKVPALYYKSIFIKLAKFSGILLHRTSSKSHG